MSIASEISRLQADRNTIRAKLVELGMATNTSNLTALAAAIEALVNRGAVSVTVKEGETYTIPAGYHNGSGTVSGVSGGGNYSLQSKSVTPTKKQQSITPDSGYYGLSDVTVSPIPDAYQDVSSVTAAAGNVLTGKVFVTANGTVTTGNMPNNGAVAKTLDVTTITYEIPEGYHNGSGKVTITLENKTVTPTKAKQTVTPTTGKVLSSVTVEPIPDNFIDTTDADATAGDILEGKFAYADTAKVEGTMPNNGAVSKDLTDILPAQWITALAAGKLSYTIPAGYHNGEGSVYARVAQVDPVTPTKAEQTISAASGAVLKSIKVNPIPDNYIDTTDADAEAVNILNGKTAYVNGVKLEGAMPNNGSTTQTMDGLTTTSVTIPAGYTSGGTISLTNDIEEALIAI